MELDDIMSIFITVFFAYVEALAIVGGLALLAIGVLIMASELHTSRARVVQAEILGVRKKGSIYFPVFSYTDRNGQRIQAESFTGSSALGDKVPGQRAKIKISEDDPTWATPCGFTWLIVAFVLIVFGAGMIGCALYFSDPSVVTACVWFAVAAHFSLKLRKIILPKGQRLSVAKFRIKVQTERDLERSSLPLLQLGDIFHLLKLEQRRIYRSAPIMMVIALLVTGFGYSEYQTAEKILASGLEAPARIVSSHRTNIEFQDNRGRLTSITDRHIELYLLYLNLFPSDGSENTPPLTVAYLPYQPEQALVKKGLVQSLDMKALIVFGLTLLFQSVRSFLKYRNLSGRI